MGSRPSASMHYRLLSMPEAMWEWQVNILNYGVGLFSLS